MKAKEIYPKYKLWTAPVRIQQPNYVGYIDVTVTNFTKGTLLGVIKK